MIRSVLTVCTANICRSPVAAHAIKRLQPGLSVGSAGIDALQGREMDPEARAASAQLGLDLPAHRARQFGDDVARGADLILVMEAHHRQAIARHWPHLLGKTFEIAAHNQEPGIPDPYRCGMAMHLRAVELILICAQSWSEQIERIR